MDCAMISDEDDQSRLNHCALHHVHQDKTDKLDLLSIAKKFVQINEHRINFFGSTNVHIIIIVNIVIIIIIIVFYHQLLLLYTAQQT